jgi:hypothetical protein
MFVCNCCVAFSLVLDRTATISPAQLSAIRNATGDANGLLGYYWRYATRQTRDDEFPGENMFGDRSYTDAFGLESRAIQAYSSVVAYNPSDPNDPVNLGYIIQLNEVRLYLFNFNWTLYKQAIKDPVGLPVYPAPQWNCDTTVDSNSPWTWNTLSDYQRAREHCYNLFFVAFMVDMLHHNQYWDVETSDQKIQYDQIKLDLQDLVMWTYNNYFNYASWNDELYDGWNIWDLFQGGSPDSNISAPIGMCIDGNKDVYNASNVSVWLPLFGESVNRFHIIAAMGYCCLVAGDPNNLLTNFIPNEFRSTNPLPADTGYHGLNDYLTTNSDVFGSGITYQNRLMYLSTLFLTALNRTQENLNLFNSTNAWNCDLIPRLVKSTLRRIDPELQHITHGDDWRYNGVVSSTGYDDKEDHSIQIERGLLSFFFQNTDDQETRNNIRWYVNELNSKGGHWPREMYEHDLLSSFEVVMN